MTPQQIIGLAIRCLSLFIGWYAVRYFFSVPMEAQLNGWANQTASLYAYGVVGLLIAVFLWFFPLSIANKIVPRTQFENHVDVRAIELARVGVSLIGIWIFGSALPDLLWVLVRGALVNTNGSIFLWLSADEQTSLWVDTFQLVFATVLVLKANALALLMTRRQA